MTTYKKPIDRKKMLHMDKIFSNQEQTNSSAMKQLFPNSSALIWKRFAKSERQARFAGIFQERDFGDANLNLYRVAVLASYFCNFISIATGFAFVYLLLSEFYTDLPAWLRYLGCGIVSSLFLVFLEYLKRETIGNNAISWLKHNKISLPSLLIIVSLVSISIFLSVKGAEQFIRKVDQSVEQESLKQSTIKDSRSKYYAEAIQSQQDSLNTFKQSVSWKGKINISNKTVAATIEHFLRNIRSLEEEKTKAFETMEKQFETRLVAMKQKSEHRANYMVWIALGNEISCMLLIFWVYYYAFRSHVEHQMGRQELPNGYHQETLKQDLFQTRNNGYEMELAIPQMDSPKSIGFDIGKQRETSPNGNRKPETLSVTLANPKHTQGFKITCDQCGTETIKFNKSARFCSETCRSNYHLDRYRQKRKKGS